MNKNAIKKVAIAARNRLIATVSDRAGMLGITKEKISQPVSKGHGFEIYETAAGTENTLNLTQIEQRRKLVDQIEASGFDVVMEEVAYTWFNRICAIRFMEVNDYLPTRVRVLSSLKEGKNEPDFLTEAPNVDLDFTEAEREWILTAKEQNRLDELFSVLFIKQCNKLSKILPELFEATEDYTEMLLSLSYTNKDDVVRMLVDGIDEADFNVTTKDESGNPVGQVEIIGWLYQYYNTELKDDTFAKLKKNIKISKERIPAATQLFTPHWIVRYMVENSVGRIWIEHLRAIDPDTDEKAVAERFGWKYYLPEAEQEPEVNSRLAEIRKSYSDLKPTDILCIDPCMGSGHIIVAQFDVLMDIYTSVGYGEREAAFEIIEHNLHGLDIDKRAYQLAYFAVMMKGRQYNRRFFRGKNQDDVSPKPKVYAFVESNEIKRGQLKYFGAGLNEIEKNNAMNQMSGLLDTFKDAREYGSILNVDNYDWALLRRFAAGLDDLGQMHFDSTGLDQAQKTMEKIINLGEVMAKKYDAVVTNPPYMSARGSMAPSLTNFLTKNYPISKNDMFTVFMEVCQRMTKNNVFYSMVNQQSWMFLAGFAKLREHLYSSVSFVNMIHIGPGAFEGIAGEVVQSVAFVIRRHHMPKYKGSFLDETNGKWHECIDEIPKSTHAYTISISEIQDIPNGILCYHLGGGAIRQYYNGKRLDAFADPRVGMATGDNDLFVRLWQEVDFTNVGIGIKDGTETLDRKERWYPYNKGGECRRWYGNRTHLVDWYHNGSTITAFKQGRLMRGEIEKKNSECWNREYYFLESISWSKVSSGRFAVRYYEPGFIFDVAGCSILGLGDNLLYVMGALNSELRNVYIESLSPTLNFETGAIKAFPVIIDKSKKNKVEDLVRECIRIEKEEWDSYEESWDFVCHPLIKKNELISNLFEAWENRCNHRITRLKEYEEQINRIFIDIYPKIN